MQICSFTKPELDFLRENCNFVNLEAEVFEMRAKGITEDCVSWYLVMNMAYNDYHDTAAMVGMSEDAEFYYSIANNFINDIDGKKYKVAKYFLDR